MRTWIEQRTTAEDAGTEAARMGEHISANPYNFNTGDLELALYKAWESGYKSEFLKVRKLG